MASNKYYKDLNEYIEALDESGLLQRYSDPINKDTEMHPLVRLQFRGLKEEDRKAWYFDNIHDANGNQHDIPLVLCAMAGSNFFMGVSGGDDCMLNYQDTSFHDDASAREILGLRPAPEFEKWLEKWGLMEDGKLTEAAGDPSIFE